MLQKNSQKVRNLENLKLQRNCFFEMKRQDVNKIAEIGDTVVNQNVQPRTGKFTFWNGDVYVGEYKVNYDRYLLVKQGNILLKHYLRLKFC